MAAPVVSSRRSGLIESYRELQGRERPERQTADNTKRTADTLKEMRGLLQNLNDLLPGMQLKVAAVPAF